MGRRRRVRRPGIRRREHRISRAAASLRNALERAVAFSDGRPIAPRDCARNEDSDGPPEALKGLADSLEAAQVKLLKALRPCIPPTSQECGTTAGEAEGL